MKNNYPIKKPEPLANVSYQVLRALAMAWHAWQAPNDEGQERAARILDRACKGRGERELFLILRERIEGLDYEQFDAMYRFWEEWQGCE